MKITDKKRKNKTKSIALGIAILSCAAVVSTGFAAWIISGGAETNVEATITADTVTNNYHTATVTWDTANNGTICFGHPSSMTNSSAWLTNNSADKVEKLTAVAKVVVANVNESTTDATTLLDTTKLTLAEDQTASYATALTAKYVGSVPAYGATSGNGVGTITLGSATYDSSAKTASFDITITFKWGEIFNYQNPYEYYNALTANSSNASAANSALTGLANVNSAKFKLTIVTK